MCWHNFSIVAGCSGADFKGTLCNFGEYLFFFFYQRRNIDLMTDSTFNITVSCCFTLLLYLQDPSKQKSLKLQFIFRLYFPLRMGCLFKGHYVVLEKKFRISIFTRLNIKIGSPEHCLKLERWQGLPHRNKVK